VKEETKRQLREATRRWLEVHLDLRLKSLAFLDLLGRDGQA